MDISSKSRFFLGSINSTEGSSSENSIKVSPTDFVKFLPWACQQLNVDAFVEVTKLVQADPQLRGKLNHIAKKVSSKRCYIENIDVNYPLCKFDSTVDLNKVVRVAALFSAPSPRNEMVQLKIECKKLPRELMAVIGLVVHFYPHLTRLSINSGANQYAIHEMCKFLPSSNICEINLDNTFIKEGNYDTILDSCKQIKLLSLSKCKLNDCVVEKIACKLEYPHESSKTLSVLNLSSNCITDDGAKSLGRMLRTNAKLAYLNIAGNMISDEGMEAILIVLLKFDLTIEETRVIQDKYIKYLKARQLLIDQYIKKFREENQKINREDDSVRSKKIARKSASFVEKLGKSSSSEKTRSASTERFKSVPIAVVLEKAVSTAMVECGRFVGPAGPNAKNPDGTLFSNGNNTLAYLNFSYNSVSQSTVRVLLAVLKYQRGLPRSPKGLVNVSLEGNPLPEGSPELAEIDRLLETGLAKGKTPLGIDLKKRKQSDVSRL